MSPASGPPSPPPPPSVVVLTGAGISADSGLATFRGPDGLWEGHRVEDVATPEAWSRDPARVWRFYQLRRAALPGAEPNAAHEALVELERRVREAGGRFTLVTQNVDDLHERAGSRGALHMHGELARLACERCGGRERDLERVDPGAFLACAACGHEPLRPDVVWFGELPHHLDEIEAATRACHDFVAIGTSGLVYPAAAYLALAREWGARTWLSALEPPENLRHGDRFREGRARDEVPKLVAELLELWGL